MELEKNLRELEEVSRKLDDKDLPLEEAIGLYEEGVKTIRKCLDELNGSKGRIEVIRGELEQMLKSGTGE